MLRIAVIAWLVIAGVGAARADSVALLPLDGEKRLEIYGQPVAAVLARALNGAGVEVVVVGANMAVPEQAKLIVDGTIKQKAKTITLELRIRDARDGTTLETLPPSSGALKNIDKVAADASSHVVPAVKTELETLAKKAAEVKPPDKPVGPDQPPVKLPEAPVLPAVVVAVSAATGVGNGGHLLQAALPHAVEAWATQHGHTVTSVDAAQLAKNKTAADNVEKAGGQLGIALQVIGLQIWPGHIPMAKARVRMRIVTLLGVKLDRVIVTDTIVGDKSISQDELLARVAREVLLIAQPNIRRTVQGWK